MWPLLVGWEEEDADCVPTTSRSQRCLMWKNWKLDNVSREKAQSLKLFERFRCDRSWKFLRIQLRKQSSETLGFLHHALGSGQWKKIEDRRDVLSLTVAVVPITATPLESDEIGSCVL